MPNFQIRTKMTPNSIYSYYVFDNSEFLYGISYLNFRVVRINENVRYSIFVAAWTAKFN